MIMTGGTILARRAVALVDTILTVGPSITVLANACIIVDTVDAIAAVHAATISAVFIVGLTIDSRETASALTRVRVDIFLANRSILTGLR